MLCVICNYFCDEIASIKKLQNIERTYIFIVVYYYDLRVNSYERLPTMFPVPQGM